jgi:signal transduction histidine kinase
MSKISKNLSTKLSLGILLLAVPIFFLTLGLFFMKSRYFIQKEAVARSNSILNTAIFQVRNFISTIETSTNTNAWLLEERFDPQSFETISKRVLKLNPNVLSISICTEPDVLAQYGRQFSIYTVREGKEIKSYQETEYEYFDKLWYKSALKSAKSCWVEPFGEHTEGTIDHNEAVASYCRPLRAEDGRIAGVIATEFDFSLLDKVIHKVEHPYKDAYFMLVGSDGRYFIHPDVSKLFRKTIYTDTDPHENADIIALGHEMNGEKRGTMHVTFDGTLCHVCYAPVPGTDWTLALVCPESEILAGYQQLAMLVAVVIIIGLLLIFWLSNKVVKQTTKPIKELMNMTQEIASGNYNETIPYSYRHDLFGKLQDSFAKMQLSLYENMNKIEQAAEELKQRNDRHQNAIDMAEAAAKEKETFIQTVSHQIRTPLNIIMGYASVLYETLKMNSANPESQDEFEKDNLTEISQAMMHNAILLKRMVLMLYDSSETGASEEKQCKREDEISCNQISRESISYTKAHTQGVKIRFETTVPDTTFILTNKVYLTRTIRELLYNAAKHSDKQHILMRVMQTETRMLFIVEDTGPGLPKDAMYVIDKPFAKMNEMSEGLGLGLPLSKRHAKNLGGDLILDTSYNIGCRFILELPR